MSYCDRLYSALSAASALSVTDRRWTLNRRGQRLLAYLRSRVARNSR